MREYAMNFDHWRIIKTIRRTDKHFPSCENYFRMIYNITHIRIWLAYKIRHFSAFVRQAEMVFVQFQNILYTAP